MDDASLVRGLERQGDLPGVVERCRERQWSFGRFSLDQLDHEVVGTDIVERADVGMVESRDCPRLALEPIAELLGRHLDGDIATDPRVARAKDDAHAAGANLLDDFVGPEPVTNRRMHAR